MQKDSNLDQKIELLLTAGQLLTENGATNDKTIRVLNRIAAFMEIPEKNVRLQIMHQHIFLEIFDGEKSVFAFRKCPKIGVDFQIIYSITKISWQIFKKSVTLEELKKILEDIAAQPKIYSHGKIIFAVGCACGGFCCLFGGTVFEIFYTAICAMIGKFFQIKLLEYKVNEFLSIAFAAFIATSCAYLFPTESLKPTVACALFLVPGVPIINAVIDTMNKFFPKASAELFRTFCIILSMTIGIFFAVETFFKMDDKNFMDFILLETVPDANIFLLATAAAICSIGFAIPLNMPKKFLYVVGILGASSVFSRYFLYFVVGFNAEYSTFIAAFLIGVFSLIIGKKLNLVSSILVVPPLLPMIPGVMIYIFLFACIKSESLATEYMVYILPFGIDILQIIFAIVIGANLPRLLANKFLTKTPVLNS